MLSQRVAWSKEDRSKMLRKIWVAWCTMVLLLGIGSAGNVILDAGRRQKQQDFSLILSKRTGSKFDASKVQPQPFSLEESQRLWAVGTGARKSESTQTDRRPLQDASLVANANRGTQLQRRMLLQDYTPSANTNRGQEPLHRRLLQDYTPSANTNNGGDHIHRGLLQDYTPTANTNKGNLDPPPP